MGVLRGMGVGKIMSVDFDEVVGECVCERSEVNMWRGRVCEEDGACLGW